MRLAINRTLRWGLALSLFLHFSAAALLGRFGVSFDKDITTVDVEILIEGDGVETVVSIPQAAPQSAPRPVKPQPPPEPISSESIDETDIVKNVKEDPKPRSETQPVQENWDELIRQSSTGSLQGRALSASEKYTMELRRALNQRLVYPTVAKRLRQKGRVTVRFWLRNDGSLLKTEVIERSNFDIFNKAAEELVKEIDGLKPFPDELKDKKVWAFSIPIEYDI